MSCEIRSASSILQLLHIEEGLQEAKPKVCAPFKVSPSLNSLTSVESFHCSIDITAFARAQASCQSLLVLRSYRCSHQNLFNYTRSNWIKVRWSPLRFINSHVILLLCSCWISISLTIPRLNNNNWCGIWHGIVTVTHEVSFGSESASKHRITHNRKANRVTHW